MVMIEVINEFSTLSKINAKLSQISGWHEVIIRKIDSKPTRSQINAYWSKLRKVGLHQGIDVKEAHRASMEACGCLYEQDGKVIEINPFDLPVGEFNNYFNSVSWYWQMELNIDLGAI